MWTILPKEHLANYENKYNLAEKYPEKEYILNITEDHIFFPRLFYKNYPDENLKLHVDSNFTGINNINIESIIEPRENQIAALSYIFDKFEKQGYVDGILNAYPGWGKTAVCTFITAKLKLKTLIIVDNKKLRDQFIEAYTTFTDLTIDDIGIIQGKQFDVDKPVTITLVQTLTSKIKKDLRGNYVKIRDAKFNLVIYDEVHKTSSGPKYALSTLFINTKNVIGLSATPYLKGAHKLLLDNSIGGTLFTAKDYELIPKIFFIKYNSTPNSKMQYMMKVVSDYVKRQAMYNKYICDNENYLYVIYKLAKKCLDSGHTTIVMCSNIAQIENIINYLGKNGVVAKPLYSKENQIDQKIDKILVASYKYASHGFDYPELSAIILASPYKGNISLIQMIGRILRKLEGKKDPVTFDLIDLQVPALFEKAIQSKIKILKTEFGEDIEIMTLDMS